MANSPDAMEGLGASMSGQKWITEERGIRYYEHPARMHGKRRDRYYTLRFTVDGKQIEEALGWLSDGWTLTKARIELAKLKEAKRVGDGAVTLRQARNEAKKKRTEAEKAEALERAAKITVDDFWLNTYSPAQGHKKESTVKKEENLYIRWLKPRFGEKPLAEVNEDLLEKLKLAMLADGKSPRTIEYTLAIFSQIWHQANRRGIVSGIPPTRNVKLPKFDNRRMRFLSKDEARSLLHALKGVSADLYTTALLSLACGLRAGEIHSLIWADVDFSNEMILIRDPKSSKNRHAYMNQEVKSVLEGRFHGQHPGELVLPSKTGGQRGQVSKAFDKVVRELGFNNGITDPRQKVVFHTLRHTFASWLVQKGTPLYTVATLMGHSTLEMTQRYAHLAPDTTKVAALSISDVFTESTGAI